MSKGTVSGVAIAPGVSRNGRLYTRENISRAYDRLRARIADPNGRPVVMRTHHAAGDDSTRIVAQVTKVGLDESGAITYTGTLADTPNAATIRELASPQGNGKPALANVSIYGWWLEDPSKVEHDGQTVETADDLEIDAIDFTASPGVQAATVRAESRFAIHESHTAEITVTEQTTAELSEADKTPYGSVTYADPGYQDDKVKRYPIDTAAHVRAAWSYINQSKNAAKYTAAQVKRIKTRIRSAAKKTGVTIADSWLYSGAPVTETVAEGGWVEGYMSGDEPGSFCFNATNGPISATISSYCIDPADLEVVTRAACQAISDALKALDPDMDGDIDLPGADAEDTDGDQMETKTPDTAVAVTETQAAPPAETTEEDPVPENTETAAKGAAEAAPVAEAAPAVKVEIDYKALAEAFVAVSQAKADADKAAAEAADADKAKVTSETAEAKPAEEAKPDLREAMKDVVRELLTENGVQASRKGYGQTETPDPAALTAEVWAKRGELLIAAARENARL